MDKFEEYAGMIERTTDIYRDRIAEAMEKVATIATNVYLSDKGKLAKRQKALEGLDNIGKNFTGISKEAAFRFLNDYQIKLPSDGKDHKLDIDNALRVIGMLGEKLDKRNLLNALEPLRGDYRSMKYVLDVLDQKTKSGLYNVGLTRSIQDLLGVNGDVVYYLDQYAHIQSLLDSPSLWYTYTLSTMGVTTTLSPSISYSILTLPDTIRQIGGIHGQLSGSFSGAAPADDMSLLKSLVS